MGYVSLQEGILFMCITFASWSLPLSAFGSDLSTSGLYSASLKMCPLSLGTSFIKETLASVGGLPGKRKALRWLVVGMFGKVWVFSYFFSRKGGTFPENDEQDDVLQHACFEVFCSIAFEVHL